HRSSQASRVCARTQTPRPSRRHRESVRVAQPERGRPDATHAAICSTHTARHSFAEGAAWLRTGTSVAHNATTAIHPRLIPTPRISAPSSRRANGPSAFPDRIRSVGASLCDQERGPGTGKQRAASSREAKLPVGTTHNGIVILLYFPPAPSTHLWAEEPHEEALLVTARWQYPFASSAPVRASVWEKWKITENAVERPVAGWEVSGTSHRSDNRVQSRHPRGIGEPARIADWLALRQSRHARTLVVGAA